MGSPPEKGGIGISFGGGKRSVREPPPLRMMVLGDFKRLARKGISKPIAVDKDELRVAFKSLGAELFFEVKDCLSGRSAPLRVHLLLWQLEDFSPAGLAKKLPELERAQSCLELQRSLVQGKISAEELKTKLAPFSDLELLVRPMHEWLARDAGSAPPATASPEEGAAAPPSPVAATPEKDDAVGRILDLVDAPDHQPAVPAVSAVSQFVSNVAAGRRTAPVPSGAAEAVRFAEQAYMAQLDEVLSHPEFQDTEATWRGLKFLVDRTDFRKGVYLEVLDTGRADLAETFHERVFVPEYEGLTRTPLSLAVACFELGNTPGDIDLLDTLGREAEEIQAPVLFSVGRGFFGPTAEDEGGGLPSPRTLILSTAYLPWRALCEKEHARWLAAAVNRFVLRTPHAETRGQETQRDSSPGRRGSLFGSPVWVVARCIAASRARSGWPTECMGFHNGAVDNLQPIPPHHVPLEMALSQEVAEDLVNLGFMPLIATPHSDSAYVLYAPSLHQPREGKAPRLQLSLPYQLLAATLARAILDRKAELTAGKSPEEIQQALELFLSEFVVNTGPGAGVAAKVTEDREDASRLNVALQVLTGDGVLGGARIEFGFGVVR